MGSGRLLVFAKAPEPGRAKTRLMPALGPQGAARLCGSMTRHCLGTAVSALPGRVELWCAPDTVHPFFAHCAVQWDLPLHRQPQGDIGQRMDEAMRVTLREVSYALIMGSDVPSITGEDLQAALTALVAGHHAVVIPTEDGGYGLIGLARYHPALFEGIAWSTASVMDQTRARLSQLGWRWQELPARWDVDRPDDTERLARDPTLRHLLLPEP